MTVGYGKHRHSWRMMPLVVIGATVILTGCETTAVEGAPRLASTAHGVLSSSTPITSLPQVQIIRIQDHVLMGYQYMAGHKVTLKLTITPQTKIWYNGKMIAYADEPNLKTNDVVSVRYQRNAAHAIDDLYGPWSQIDGIVQKVSSHSVVIQTTRPAMDPPGTPFTSHTWTLVFNATSQFSGTSAASLQPGRLLNAQVIGFSSGTRFIVNASVYRRKGPHQWMQVGSAK